jgi:hypothetical protein
MLDTCTKDITTGKITHHYRGTSFMRQHNPEMQDIKMLTGIVLSPSPLPPSPRLCLGPPRFLTHSWMCERSRPATLSASLACWGVGVASSARLATKHKMSVSEMQDIKKLTGIVLAELELLKTRARECTRARAKGREGGGGALSLPLFLSRSLSFSLHTSHTQTDSN